MRKSKYTHAVLAPIVARCTSLAEVLHALGLKATGGNYRMISARVRAAGIDVAHITTTHAMRCNALTLADVADAARRCTSFAQLAAALGLPIEGRGHRELTRRVRELGVDTSHFQGRGWSRGRTAQTDPVVAELAAKQRVPDTDVFVENSHYLSGRGLRRRLLAGGTPYACTWCGLTEWRGERLVLHLDHINGINNDHRVDNLRFLCPNCHSQTPTYGNRARESVCYTSGTRRERGVIGSRTSFRY